MARPWMSIVVPVYNEERAVLGTVGAVSEWLEATGRPYEIVVVDNASEDETVRRLEAVLDGRRIRVLRNDANRGKGYSVRRGMLDSTGELRLMCDADCASSLPSLGRMVELVERGEADVVAGSREAAGSRVGRTQPIPRRIAGFHFLALCRLIMGEPLRDIFCGFKLFRDTAAVDAFSRQTQEGWTFDVEVLALARGMGHTVVESGIAWNDRAGSRLKMHRVLVPVVVELLRARASVRRSLERSRGAAPGGHEPLVAEPVEPGP